MFNEISFFPPSSPPLRLYWRQGRGLMLRSIKESGHNRPGEILYPNATPSFDGCLGPGGDIFVLTRNSMGEIVLIRHNGGLWRKIVLLTPPNPSDTGERVRLLECKGQIFALYPLCDQGENLLMAHNLTRQGELKPGVIDSLQSLYNSFELCCDGAGRVLCVTHNSAGILGAHVLLTPNLDCSFYFPLMRAAPIEGLGCACFSGELHAAFLGGSRLMAIRADLSRRRVHRIFDLCQGCSDFLLLPGSKEGPELFFQKGGEVYRSPMATLPATPAALNQSGRGRLIRKKVCGGPGGGILPFLEGDEGAVDLVPDLSLSEAVL